MKALRKHFTPSLRHVKENFHLKYLGLPRKWLTPKLEQQVVPAKSRAFSFSILQTKPRNRNR